MSHYNDTWLAKIRHSMLGILAFGKAARRMIHLGIVLLFNSLCFVAHFSLYFLVATILTSGPIVIIFQSIKLLYSKIYWTFLVSAVVASAIGAGYLTIKRYRAAFPLNPSTTPADIQPERLRAFRSTLWPNKFSTYPDIDALMKKRDEKGLVQALKYRDLRVKWDAAIALNKITDGRKYASAFNFLIGAGESTEIIADIIKNDKGWKAKSVLNILGKHQVFYYNPAVEKIVCSLAEPLADILVNSQDHNLRYVAADILGHIKDKNVVNFLYRALGDREQRVREIAEEGIRRLRGSL